MKTRVESDFGVCNQRLNTLLSSFAFKCNLRRYQLVALPGDVVIAAAFMSYAGPFPSEYRDVGLLLWLNTPSLPSQHPCNTPSTPPQHPLITHSTRCRSVFADL